MGFAPQPPSGVPVGGRFENWVGTQLAPELQPGDVLILDNVGFHKSKRAAGLVRVRLRAKA